MSAQDVFWTCLSWYCIMKVGGWILDAFFESYLYTVLF